MAAPIRTTQQTSRLIRLPKVKDCTGLSTTDIYRRIAAGTFPAQVTLGPKSVAWVEGEIMAWCEARIAERDGYGHSL